MTLSALILYDVISDKSEVTAFSPKSSWSPPQGHSNLEVHLS